MNGMNARPGISGAQTTQGVKPTPSHIAVNLLDETISALSHDLDRLEQQLAVAMTGSVPPPENTKESVDAAIGGSALVCKLQGFNSQLQRLRVRIAQISERVEL